MLISEMPFVFSSDADYVAHCKIIFKTREREIDIEIDRERERERERILICIFRIVICVFFHNNIFEYIKSNY